MVKEMAAALRRLVRLVVRIDRRQAVFLLAAFLSAAGILGFLALARELGEEDTRELDAAVLLAFRVPGEPDRLRGPEELLKATRDLTALGGTPVLTLVVLFFSGYLLLKGRTRMLILLLAATLGGVLLTVGFKSYFGRVRPAAVAHLMIETSMSFPSGHSSMSAVVYLTVGSIVGLSQDRLRLRIYLISAALFVSILIGLTRIMLGVHYPTDVLAGWSLGVAWASICWFAALLVRYRGKRPGRSRPDG